jgi:putative ABC transport system permease protein
VSRFGGREFARRLIRIAEARLPEDIREAVAGDLLECYERTARASTFRANVQLVGAVLRAVWTLRATPESEGNASHCSMAVGLLQDARSALHHFLRVPAFAVLCATILGAGLATTAIAFGMIDQLMLRGPAGLRRPDELRRVYATVRKSDGHTATGANMSYSAFQALSRAMGGVGDVAGYDMGTAFVGLAGDGRSVAAVGVTQRYFQLLGIQPYRGRFVLRGDGADARQTREVVLSFEFWMRHTGGDSSLLGTYVTVDSKAFQVVGIAPAGFNGTTFDPVDIWLPIDAAAHPSTDWRTSWRSQFVQVITRVVGDDRHTRDSSAQAFEGRATAVLRRAPGEAVATWRVEKISLLPISYTVDGTSPPYRASLLWIGSIAALVLAVAAATVAALFLGDILDRGRELTIRTTMGLPRARLIRVLWTEAVVMALMADGAALAWTRVGGELARRVILPPMVWPTRVVDWRVAALTITLGVVVATLSAVPAGLHFATHDRSWMVRSASYIAPAWLGRFRTAITAVQVASTVALLAVAGLFGRSLINVECASLGIDVDRIFAISMRRPVSSRQTPRRDDADVWFALREALLRSGEFEAVSLVSGSPFRNAVQMMIRLRENGSGTSRRETHAIVTSVGAHYFQAAGTRIVRGRAFTATETRSDAAVVVIGQTLAQALWPNAEPIGQCIMVAEKTSRCSTVVGVAADAHVFSVREQPTYRFYIPWMDEQGLRGATVLARFRASAGDARDVISRAIKAVAPDADVLTVERLDERLEPQIRPWRMAAYILAGYSAACIAIAVVGAFVVTSSSMAQRSREFGVRMTLGATRGGLIADVVMRELRATALSQVAGALVVASAGRYLEPHLFGESARDPFVYVSAVGCVVLTTLIGGGLAAMRHLGPDAASALRGGQS